MIKQSIIKKAILIICNAYLPVCFFNSCNSGSSLDNSSIAKDSLTIAAGDFSFNKNCSGCHNFRQDAIGPQLSGVTTKKSFEWLTRYIKNPQEVISSGDKAAQELLKQYKVVMPSFGYLPDSEINAVIAFIHTHQSVAVKSEKAIVKGLANPIPEPIALSNLVVDLKPVTQFPASNDSAPKARITKLGFQPNSPDLFVVDLRGKLYRLKNGKPKVYMDMAKLKPKFINQPGLATGFGSFAFHPGFAKNGLLYTTHTEAPGSVVADFRYADSIKVTVQWVLTEWKVSDPNADSFSGTGRELFRVNMVSGIHGVQEITFNPLSKPGDEDYGLLYIGIGDGGSVEEGYSFIAHSRDKIWGSIIRIDPSGNNSANGKYGIPKTNPFVRDLNSKGIGEVYAYGFRNPHRITWTRSGEMLACNIGQANIESINLIKPGNDYGWPLREGNFVTADINENLGNVFPLPANDSIYKITYPVAEYDHDEGKAISGGYEYWGSSIPQLKGKYLFGDIPSGRLFYVDIADLKQGKQAVIKEWKITINGVPKTLKVACSNDRVDLHFGRDAKGELYIMTKADGKLYKLETAK